MKASTGVRTTNETSEFEDLEARGTAGRVTGWKAQCGSFALSAESAWMSMADAVDAESNVGREPAGTRTPMRKKTAVLREFLAWIANRAMCASYLIRLDQLHKPGLNRPDAQAAQLDTANQVHFGAYLSRNFRNSNTRR
jgi:hypothetical protein